ncbi:MAG: methylmalonyl-CoA mutase subunit beta [Jatrophihabitantaceae bacterium]
MDAPVPTGEALDLAAGFAPADLAQWRELVTAVLTKSRVEIPDPAAPESALAHAGYDGFDIAPLYTAPLNAAPPYTAPLNAALLNAAPLHTAAEPADPAGLPGRPPFVRGALADRGQGWDVRQQHRDPDPAALNRAVLTDLDNGVSSLWLVLGAAGLAVADLPRGLAGVHLELISIVLDAGADSAAATEEWLRLAAGLAPDQLRGNLGLDPIGLAARTGTEPDLDAAVRAAERAAGYPGLLPITVDATAYHDAGGSDSDELAISLAVGVAYLRALTDAGQDLADSFDQLEFRYAVTANQFDSIAKLRAARLIWDRIGELSGLGADRRGQRQHAVTSAAMLTRRDPWVNILRGTVACFAAAVGGAEAITVAPFDAALGLPDAFGRRIARNTQAVLHDESSLARVTDPGGGSFYLERITDQLAEAAWAKFSALERAGGAVAALASGAIAELIEASWLRRRDNLAHRRDPITGVSEFAMPSEQALTRQPVPDPAGAGLPVHRYAEDFEALRDRSDKLLAERGARPKVLLAALGPVAQHSARLAFASNLAEVGGFEPVMAVGDPAALAEAFATSGAALACLCSSDKVYADLAQPAAEALRAAGAQQVWIAGKPALATGSIDSAIFAGCDALAALQALYELEGVTA